MLFTLAHRIVFFCGMRGNIKVNNRSRNLGFGDSVGLSQFHLFCDPKNVRA